MVIYEEFYVCSTEIPTLSFRIECENLGWGTLGLGLSKH
jgi:hypothetical protein